MHSCVGAVLIQDREILLGQWSLGRSLSPGTSDVFGGHIELHEQAEHALLRELKEEIGIEPTEWLYLQTINATLDAAVIECPIYKVTG
jgi:8-oxo-dGTP diphosphatase